MINKILFRRGNRASLPTLNNGEPAFVTDEKELYIGTSAGNIKITNRAEIQNMITKGVFYTELSSFMELDTLVEDIQNINIIETNDEYDKCISLATYISNLPSNYCGFLDIKQDSVIYNELYSVIPDTVIYLKIEKISNTFAMLTLTGETIENTFIGHYRSGVIKWNQLQFV